MTPFLITSQILVFIHAVFGEIAGASLLWSVKELIYLKSERFKWLRVSYWIAFIGSILAWIAGGSYYLFLYPQVKPVIKEGPEAWGHLVITESKEHMFFLIPVLLFFLAMFAAKRTEKLLTDHKLKNRFLFLTILAALLVFSMAAMGFLITWSARAALWVKSGL